MMKNKREYSNYDKETGVATITIETSIGKFIGTAKAHEEDKEYKSEFTGCVIAESRAYLQYYEKILYKLNIEIKTLEAVNLKIGYDDASINYILKEKKTYKKQLTAIIKRLKETPDKVFEDRKRIVEKINKKIEKKKEELEKQIEEV